MLHAASDDLRLRIDNLKMSNTLLDFWCKDREDAEDIIAFVRRHSRPLARPIHEDVNRSPCGLRLRPADGPPLRAGPEQGAQHRVEAALAATSGGEAADERTTAVRE